MFNILSLFSWSTWLFTVLFTIFIFWAIWGGKNEYEFVGIKPLSTPKLFEDTMSYQVPVQAYIPKASANTNKGEDLMAEALENILASPVQRNIRPDFLCNPETGKNMELDCFNEEYAVAVEYNGIQHYKFPSIFYKTEADFYKQVNRDRLKRQLCDENGIYLISIPYWVDMYDSHEEHTKETDAKRKINYVSRDVRYKRIYEYLYQKLQEYFEIIFPQEENEQDEDTDNRWTIYNTL